MVEVDAHVVAAEGLVGVQDDLEAVAVHAPTLVPLGDVRQAMSSLEAEATPDVGVLGIIQVRALVAGALDAHRFDTGHLETAADPVLPRPTSSQDRKEWGNSRVARCTTRA